MAEGQRIKADLQSSLRQLSITQEKYHKAFGASERALDAYHKADADINLSRAEVRDKKVEDVQFFWRILAYHIIRYEAHFAFEQKNILFFFFGRSCQMQTHKMTCKYIHHQKFALEFFSIFLHQLPTYL